MTGGDPWNLSALQVEALKVTIECGGREKVAAQKLGVARMTLTSRVVEARKKIGAETRIAALLEWDRWIRSRRGTA